MSFLVRYWNAENNGAVARYKTSKFFRHATAVDFTNICLEVIEKKIYNLICFVICQLMELISWGSLDCVLKENGHN